MEPKETIVTTIDIEIQERKAALEKVIAETEARKAETQKLELWMSAQELNRLKSEAEIAHNSKLFGTSCPEQCATLMLLAKAYGIEPILALQQFDIIEGKPAMRSVAMQSRFQKAGGRVEWLTYTDDHVSAQFSHPESGSITIVCSWEDSKDPSGFAVKGFKGKTFTTTKDGHVKPNWRDHRRAMLRSRCVSEGIRTLLPGIIHGIYTPEEIEEMSANRVLSATQSAREIANRLPPGQETDRLAEVRESLAQARTIDEVDLIEFGAREIPEAKALCDERRAKLAK